MLGGFDRAAIHGQKTQPGRYICPEFFKAKAAGIDCISSVYVDSFAMGVTICDVISKFRFWADLSADCEFTNIMSNDEVAINLPKELTGHLAKNVVKLVAKVPALRLKIATFNRSRLFKESSVAKLNNMLAKEEQKQEKEAIKMSNQKVQKRTYKNEELLDFWISAGFEQDSVIQWEELFQELRRFVGTQTGYYLDVKAIQKAIDPLMYFETTQFRTVLNAVQEESPKIFFKRYFINVVEKNTLEFNLKYPKKLITASKSEHRINIGVEKVKRHVSVPGMFKNDPANMAKALDVHEVHLSLDEIPESSATVSKTPKMAPDVTASVFKNDSLKRRVPAVSVIVTVVTIFLFITIAVATTLVLLLQPKPEPVVQYDYVDNVLVTTYAGTGRPGSTNGIVDAATFNSPEGITLDSKGTIYIADGFTRSLRIINMPGFVTSISADVNNRESHPSGVAGAANGTIYMSDTGSNVIYQLSEDQSSLTGLFGSGLTGFANGAAKLAIFNTPKGILIESGALYVADTSNHVLRVVSNTGDVSTFSGSGAVGFRDGRSAIARFHSPTGIAKDPNTGVFYVADSGNHAIRMIDNDGFVTTIAGSGMAGKSNGKGANATFNFPRDVAVDDLSNIYVADSGNSVIRKISSDGTVTTYAGSYAAGFKNGDATTCQFNSPYGIAIDKVGDLYISDTFNNRIRKVTKIIGLS